MVLEEPSAVEGVRRRSLRPWLLLALALLLSFSAVASGSLSGREGASLPSAPSLTHGPLSAPSRSESAPASPAAGGGVPTWTNLTSKVGAPPYDGAPEEEVYDGATGLVVVTQPIGSGAGAIEGTFTFNGTVWTNLTGSLSTSPPALWGPSLAYDAGDGYLLLFGGDHATASGVLSPSDYSWAFHAGVWTNLTGGSTPPPATGDGSSAMTWDGQDGYVLLYVVCASGCLVPQTWSFSGGIWSRLTTTSVPPSRSGGAMTYDTSAGEVVLFGGTSLVSGADLNDTWTYAEDAWSNETTALLRAPPPSVPAGAVFDATADQLELVLGQRQVCSLWPCRSVATRATWKFANGAWSNLTSELSGSPPPGGDAIAFDTALGSSFLLGFSNGPVEGQTWKLQVAFSPLTATAPSAVPGIADVGTLLNISTSASGGTGLLGYSWSGLPLGCASANRSYLSCSPTAAATYEVRVNVTDYTGGVVEAGPTPLVVNTDPEVAGLTTTRSVLTVGISVRFTASVSGGTGPGSFTWSGLPGGCTGANSSSLPCVPAGSGTFTVSVVYEDLADFSSRATVDLWVEPRPTILSFTVAPSPNATEGTLFTFGLRAEGGSGGLTYNYSGLPEGCDSSNATSFSCTPSEAGVFTVHASATDGDGAAASAYLVLSILSNATSESPTTFQQSSTALYVVVAVIAVALVLAVVVLLWRRRSLGLGPSPLFGTSFAPPVPPRPAGETPSVPAPESSEFLEGPEFEPSPGTGSVPGPSVPGTPPLPVSPGTSPAPPVLGSPPPTAQAPAFAPPPSPVSSSLTPPGGPLPAPATGAAVCVICGGQGRLDPATGKYYCPRCDRRY